MTLFHDDFTATAADWTNYEGEAFVGKVDSENGYYELQALDDNDHVPYRQIDSFKEFPASYQIRCELELVEGKLTRGFGVVFGLSDDKKNRYRYRISGNAQYYLDRRDGGSEIVEVPWTPAPSVNENCGAKNELLIEVWPRRQRFSVNGEVISVQKYAAPASTGIGFHVPTGATLRVHSVSVLPLDLPESEARLPDEKSLDELLVEFDRLIGMPEIKGEIRTLINMVRVQQRRRELGVAATETGNHIVLTGPPGTGKTTVARMLGEIFERLGVLTKGHLVETDRSGMVASYIGQTAAKVDEIVAQARGGVLFIDEAYALMRAGASGQDFGQEAIDVLLKRMEDLRDDLVVIIAGYPDEMGVFLEANPGLKSRFNRFFEFRHYTPQELVQIFELLADQSDYELTAEASTAAQDHLARAFAARDKSFGNGRYARNLLDKAIELQANRLMTDDDLDLDEVTTIEGADIPTALLNGMVEASAPTRSDTQYL